MADFPNCFIGYLCRAFLIGILFGCKLAQRIQVNSDDTKLVGAKLFGTGHYRYFIMEQTIAHPD